MGPFRPACPLFRARVGVAARCRPTSGRRPRAARGGPLRVQLAGRANVPKSGAGLERPVRWPADWIPGARAAAAAAAAARKKERPGRKWASQPASQCD